MRAFAFVSAALPAFATVALALPAFATVSAILRAFAVLVAVAVVAFAARAAVPAATPAPLAISSGLFASIGRAAAGGLPVPSAADPAVVVLAAADRSDADIHTRRGRRSAAAIGAHER
jgi:hypothetical protein